MVRLLVALSVLSVGCQKSNSDLVVDTTGVPFLGNGSGQLADVQRTVISTSDDGLRIPADLEFHPSRDELWVINVWEDIVDEAPRAGSVTVVTAPAKAGQSTQTFRANNAGGRHFLPRPVSLAFSLVNENFATIHDTDQFTQGAGGTPGNFMGPTLWPSNEVFDAGHGSHLDMLHNTPLGKGIAWDPYAESGNAFWVWDGHHQSITFYDFNEDHGYGGADHSDGTIIRFVEGQVQASADYPAHLVVDAATGMLYAVDPGNGRICAFDTASGERGANLAPNYDGIRDFHKMTGVDLGAVVDTAAAGIVQPVGLALYDGMILVSDAADGKIFAFGMDGELVDALDVGGSPHGLEVGPDGALYYTDAVDHQVIRLAAP